MNTKLLIPLLFLFSCSQEIDVESVKKELIDMDKQFSQLSVEKGRNQAFLTYLDEEGVVLRSNGLPMKGKNAIAETYANQPDSNYTLRWQPLHATAAKSGDLGYTYGAWRYNNKDTVL